MASEGEFLPQKSIPVLFLKTRSTPTDAYEELFASATVAADTPFVPCFIPVLKHQFQKNGIARLRNLLEGRAFVPDSSQYRFGGLIFTSQRAVEAFAHVVEQGRSTADTAWPHLQDVPIYSVGPATTRALQAISQQSPFQIFGQHTGNGEALAAFILDHYKTWYRNTNPPLLFLVGEQRRDIIPRTLMGDLLSEERRIDVVEEVVYGTGEMESFPADFTAKLLSSSFTSAASRWIVVFSPTGCDSMLRGLKMLDEATHKVLPRSRDGHTFIATIGPTTKEFLISKFGFKPDVCAETPSPSGVLKAILEFQARNI